MLDEEAIAVLPLLAIAATASTACGGSNQSGTKPVSGYVFERLASRAGAVSYSVYPERLSDLLPNVKYIDTNPERSSPRQLSSPVVVGRIGSIEDGAAHTWPREEDWQRDHPGEPYDDAPVVLPFDDQRAMTRSLLLRVVVEERIDAGPKPAEVIVEVVFDGDDDIDRARRELDSLGRVLLFLNEDLRQREQAVFRIAYEGEMVATIGSGDQIRFPAMGERDPHFRGDIETLSDLGEAAHAEERLVELDM